MKRSTKKQLLSLFILFAFLGSSITYALISAVPQEDIQSNWAARIDIVIDNQLYPIPAGIGITGGNITSKLFTSSSNNIIYKKGTEDATLREFFEIWGKNFNYTCVLEYCNGASASMRMYVNNAENFDYDLYKLKSGDYVQIDYRQIYTMPTPNATISPNETSVLNETLNSTEPNST